MQRKTVVMLVLAAVWSVGLIVAAAFAPVRADSPAPAFSGAISAS
jgi:hypothetical protein